MRRHMYLIRDKKSGIYKYKREYPVALRDAIGKRWFVYSLGTKELPEANKRFKDGQKRYEQAIEEYADYGYVVPPDIQLSLVPELKQRFFLPRDKKTVTLPDLMGVKERLTQTLLSVKAKMQANGEDCTVFSTATKNYQPAKQMAECYQDLLFRLDNAIRTTKGDEVIEREAFGDTLISSAASAIVPRPAKVATALIPAHLVHGPRLSRGLELWKKSAEAQPKTIADREYAVKRFNELYEMDVPVATITKKMCLEYRDAIKELPLIKSHKTRALPIKELQKLAKAGKLDMSDMPSNRTVNKMLDGIRTVIQAVIDQEDGFEDMHNPVERLALKKKNKFHRVEFTKEDLIRFFSSPAFSGCAGVDERDKPGNQIIRDAFFWIPPLSLFSGARQEEIAQLHMTDIYEDAPIPHYHINQYGDNKRVKTVESQRVIPIHDELIKCGFLDYVKKIRAAGEERLFPEFDRENFEQRYAKNYSKKFNEYLEGLGIKPPRKSRTMKDFHSYRHLFKTACRRADLPTEFHHFLTGHTDGKVVGDDYGMFPLETSNRHMQKISFPFLDFSSLYVKDSSTPAPEHKKKRLRPWREKAKDEVPAQDTPPQKKRLKLKQRVSVPA